MAELKIAHDTFLVIVEQAKQALDGRFGFACAFAKPTDLGAIRALIDADRHSVNVLTKYARAMVTAPPSSDDTRRCNIYLEWSIPEIQAHSDAFARLVPRKTMPFTRYYSRLTTAFGALWNIVSPTEAKN